MEKQQIIETLDFWIKEWEQQAKESASLDRTQDAFIIGYKEGKLDAVNHLKEVIAALS